MNEEYGVAIIVFFAFIVLLYIIVSPSKPKKTDQENKIADSPSLVFEG